MYVSKEVGWRGNRVLWNCVYFLLFPWISVWEGLCCHPSEIWSGGEWAPCFLMKYYVMGKWISNLFANACFRLFKLTSFSHSSPQIMEMPRCTMLGVKPPPGSSFWKIIYCNKYILSNIFYKIHSSTYILLKTFYVFAFLNKEPPWSLCALSKSKVHFFSVL